MANTEIDDIDPIAAGTYDIARISSCNNGAARALLDIIVQFPPGCHVLYAGAKYVVWGYSDWTSTVGIRLMQPGVAGSRVTVGCKTLTLLGE